MVWTQQKQKRLRRGGNKHRRTVQKDLHNPDNHNGVITHLDSQTCWSAKSGGPEEASLWTKLEEVTDFQLSYFKS